MKSKYPRITRVENIQSGRKKCFLCNQPKAIYKTTIEIDCYRGDDDVLNVCEECFDENDYLQEIKNNTDFKHVRKG